MPIDYSKWDKLECSSSSSSSEEEVEFNVPETQGSPEQPKGAPGGMVRTRSALTALEENAAALTLQGDEEGDSASEMRSNIQDKTSWWKALKAGDRYEWLVNCYQMRVDDDYAWGGILRGLYISSGDDDGPNRMYIAKDFYVFCCMAEENRVLPGEFKWRPFIEKAKKLLCYAFEKSDAKERWGGENVFSALMGRPSLRLTAEHVYGIAMGLYGERDPSYKQFNLKVEAYEKEFDKCYGSPNEKVKKRVYGAYGGAKLWAELLLDMGY